MKNVGGHTQSHIWSYGESLLDNHEVWFGDEFLHRPFEGWEVDWSILDRRDLKLDPIKDGDYNKGVIIKLPERQRVWVLTGEYDMYTNGYLGRWPD